MKRAWSMTLRMALVVVIALVVHDGCAHVLDREAVVERMLSPGGEGALGAAIVTALFLVLRLAVLFVLPGVVLARLARFANRSR